MDIEFDLQTERGDWRSRCPPAAGAVKSYTLTNNSAVSKRTGTRYCFTDQSGIIRYNFGAAATVASNPIG
jgi:hypothetical protein